MDERYKAAILETCAPVQRPALEEAPLPEFDLGIAQVCPHCSGLNALVSESEEDGEVANCPDCGCAFSPKIEGLSRRVIRKLAERRERRLSIVGRYEALSATTPRGMDPDDYAAFRVAVNGQEEPELQPAEELPV